MYVCIYGCVCDPLDPDYPNGSVSFCNFEASCQDGPS